LVEKVHACLEATSTYGHSVATYLHGLGHVVSIVNPAQIKGFAQSRPSSSQKMIAIPQKLTLPKSSPLIITKNDRHSQKIDSPKMIALSAVKVIALSKAKIVLLKSKAIALLKAKIAFSKTKKIAVLKFTQQEDYNYSSIPLTQISYSLISISSFQMIPLPDGSS
jgi:hypothetical protein